MEKLIKKYKNRRLYDTEKSQYITIENLQNYVAEGIAFRVVDSTTNADLTNVTLLQVLVEMESSASQFLSANLLRHLIMAAQHPMSQFFKNMLEQLFAQLPMFHEGHPKDYKHFTADWQKNMQDMANAWQNFFKPGNH